MLYNNQSIQCCDVLFYICHAVGHMIQSAQGSVTDCHLETGGDMKTPGIPFQFTKCFHVKMILMLKKCIMYSFFHEQTMMFIVDLKGFFLYRYYF